MKFSILHSPFSIFTNALIVDGSGAEPRRGSLTVADGKIVSVDYGEISTNRQSENFDIVDCGGLALAPGFIDTHSHSDTYALLRPDAPSKIAQGVTTEIVGQCGASASPICSVGAARRQTSPLGIENFQPLPSDWASHSYPWQWHDIATYLAALRAASPRTHIVPMTGHRNLRIA
ncbi:MAG: amidohydrolase family protein, partial [Kiritimatiellaeota bacterium]|nr:amidohydrolase family protein [Kiritimatiellota bacterium]